jgi:hypothetical protein
VRTLGFSFAIAFAAIAAFPVTRAPTFSGTQPQLASSAGRVYLAFGRGDVIGVARSGDEGATFDPPVPLPVTGRVSLGRHRGPRMAATTAAILVTAVVGARGGGADGDVVLYRSRDLGRTWAKPRVINDAAGSAREGLHAMAASPGGRVVIAWLDLRQKGTRVYAAMSNDHGATWTPNALVYTSPSGTVCECCHPSLAVSEREVAVMFRNSLDGNRDMYVARAVDGQFRDAVKLGAESWLLNACPMDGGGLAFAGDALVAVWRRDTGVFVSTADVRERRLGEGRDPSISAIGSRYDIAWSSPAGLMVSRGDEPPVAIGQGGFPAVLALNSKTLVASEHQGTIEVRSIGR